jgi:thiol-disulfide isomerase/thioredoxin
MFGFKHSQKLSSCVFASLALAFATGVIGQALDKPGPAQPGEPTDPKARKTYAGAIDYERHGMKSAALGDFRKANKQDGGHCIKCVDRAYLLALEIGDTKAAEAVITDQMPLATNDMDRAELHYRLALAQQRQGINDKKEKCFADSCQEFKTALTLNPQYLDAHYALGISLAYLHQDDTARDEFKAFLNQDKKELSLHERVQRYVDRIELARSRMAPPFTATTIDGQRISLDGLAGKVVLIDFWATWCGPCREALPHVKEIAHRFAGQPFVVLSVSFDDDDAKWREFVARNQMTWLQARDGRFAGPISREFDVDAIPATFTIDADGVLEDQHVGDADIEGKLKKLIGRAQELANRKNAEPAPVNPAPVAPSAAASTSNVE